MKSKTLFYYYICNDTLQLCDLIPQIVAWDSLSQSCILQLWKSLWFRIFSIIHCSTFHRTQFTSIGNLVNHAIINRMVTTFVVTLQNWQDSNINLFLLLRIDTWNAGIWGRSSLNILSRWPKIIPLLSLFTR